MLSSNGGDKDVSLGIARIAHEFGMLGLVRIKCHEWLRDHCFVGVAWPLSATGESFDRFRSACALAARWQMTVE